MARSVGALLGRGVKQIQCGGMFNCALTYSGDLIIAGSTKSLAENFASPFRTVPNVVSMAVGSKDVIFIQIDGSVGTMMASDPTEVQMVDFLP